MVLTGTSFITETVSLRDVNAIAPALLCVGDEDGGILVAVDGGGDILSGRESGLRCLLRRAVCCCVLALDPADDVGLAFDAEIKKKVIC